MSRAAISGIVAGLHIDDVIEAIMRQPLLLRAPLVTTCGSTSIGLWCRLGHAEPA
ncbi:hypothetical protein ACQQ2N_20435 [Dokdonella sp. MW10]|uniref:hypothetical protein n=1 Tax=Dokdonella sp. MW10 TaxID=2992926 RepID=UPI003F801043